MTKILIIVKKIQIILTSGEKEYIHLVKDIVINLIQIWIYI